MSCIIFMNLVWLTSSYCERLPISRSLGKGSLGDWWFEYFSLRMLLLKKIHGNPSLLRCPILGTLNLRGCKVTLENIGPEDSTHLCKYTTIQLKRQTLQLFADFHNPAAASRYSLWCISKLSQASVTHSLTELPKSPEEKWMARCGLKMGMHRSSASGGLQRDGLQSQNPSSPQLSSWPPPQHGMVKHYNLLHDPLHQFTTMSQRWFKRFLAFAILVHSFPPRL